jgi:hypothetical protein
MIDSQKMCTFDQFAVWPKSIILSTVFPALEEVMENFADLMQRLLEIQSGGRQRSPELVAEDERLMDGLQKRSLAGKPVQLAQTRSDDSKQTRLKA